MKALDEIYKIKFGNIIDKGNTTYFICVLGSEGIIYNESVIPESIILKGTKVITIHFTNETYMVIPL